MTQSTTCIYCKLEATQFQYELSDIFLDKYSIIKCQHCGAYSLAPFPTLAQLERAYDDSYYGANDEKFEGIFEKVLDFFRQKRAKQVAQYIPYGGSVLDIGCGNGRFLISLEKYGQYVLHGLELPGNSAKRAARHRQIDLKVGRLADSDFKDASLDVITLFHVFEHLDNPSETLDVIDKKMKREGHLVMSFPNIASWQSKYFKNNWLHLDPPRHLFFFEPKDYISMMEKRGYSLVDIAYLSTEQNPFGFVQSLLNKWVAKRDLLFESMKGNVGYLVGYSKFKLFLQKLFFYGFFGVATVFDVFAAMLKRGATVQIILKKK